MGKIKPKWNRGVPSHECEAIHPGVFAVVQHDTLFPRFQHDFYRCAGHEFEPQSARAGLPPSPHQFNLSSNFSVSSTPK